MRSQFIPAARFAILTPVFDTFCRIVGLGKKYRKKIITQLGLISTGAKVLDAGCGSASLTIEIKNTFPTISLSAVDADPNILAMAEKKAHAQNISINFKEAFLQKLPFIDNSFDVVYSSLVFHHLNKNSKNEAMKEIYRVLKKNGRFLLVDFGKVAVLAKKGKSYVTRVGLEPGRPTKVMLAILVNSVSEGFEYLGNPCQLEVKLDGFRVIIHNDGKNISLFTRRMENVTNQFKELIPIIKKNIKGESYIIDTELVGYDPKTKKYMPFQSISQRIKRKYDIEIMSKKFPVHHFAKMHDLTKYLHNVVKPKSYVLVKGSQNTIYLERAVESILENHADVAKLCRRGIYWDNLRNKATK